MFVIETHPLQVLGKIHRGAAAVLGHQPMIAPPQPVSDYLSQAPAHDTILTFCDLISTEEAVRARRKRRRAPHCNGASITDHNKVINRKSVLVPHYGKISEKLYWSTACCTVLSHHKGAKGAKFYTNPLRSLRLCGNEPLRIFMYRYHLKKSGRDVGRIWQSALHPPSY